MELNREQVIKALECWTKNFDGKVTDFKTLCEATLLIKELTEEKTNLEYTLDGVMLSVDKWLDVAELEQDKVNRAITMREKTLQIVERLTEENERLIGKGEWISVAERLPDNYRAVLVVCESTSISGGRLRAVGSYGGGFWSMADADGTMRLTKYMQYTVTHWMELPTVPKGE